EGIWTLLNFLDPMAYPNRRIFRDTYLRTTGGLARLSSELSTRMLRRSKEGTIPYFLPLEEMPFREQLAGDLPRTPRRTRLQPLSYILTHEQSALIARMISDFRGWAEEHNE